MSLFALPGMIASLPSGMLADRYGIKKIGLAVRHLAVGIDVTWVERGWDRLIGPEHDHRGGGESVGCDQVLHKELIVRHP